MELQIKLSLAQEPEWIAKEYQSLIAVGTKLLVFNKDQLLIPKLPDTDTDTDTHNTFAGINPITSLHLLPEDLWQSSLKYYLGLMNQQPIFAIELEDFKIPISFGAIPLKSFLETLSEPLKHLVFRGKQLLNWHRNSLYCGRCGGKTKYSESETAKLCDHCQRVIYPHTSPAVLVLIEKSEEILLARSPYFRQGVYSVLAGFVEAGESAEDTLIREVDEEVGIQVKNIRYFASQSWPFENSFMMAFRADYHAGEIIINPNEIEDARWFTLDALPALPFKSSLSRILIESYIKERRGEHRS